MRICPASHSYKPADEAHQRRLARAAASHHAHHLARLDGKADVFQHRPVAIVAEGHVLELDAALEAGQGRGRLGSARFRWARRAGRRYGGWCCKNWRTRWSTRQSWSAARRTSPGRRGRPPASRASCCRRARRGRRCTRPPGRPTANNKPIAAVKVDGGIVDRQPRVAQPAAGCGEAANLALLLHEGLDHADPREHPHQGRSLLADGRPIVLMPRL